MTWPLYQKILEQERPFAEGKRSPQEMQATGLVGPAEASMRLSRYFAPHW
jgi:hypothetical protein